MKENRELSNAVVAVRALHDRVTEYARRAFAANDPVLEDGYRRRVRHYLRCAAELDSVIRSHQDAAAERSLPGARR